MKSLIRKIFQSKISIELRNLLNIKPLHMSITHIKEATSVSDAFCWRTDNSFQTTFKFSDILELFYKVKNSYAEIIFFNKNNEEIKKVNIKNLNLSNELIINKKYLDGIEDFGAFYIYHRFDNDLKDNFILSNRCYLGFSYKENMNSFVHGNTLASYQNLKGNNKRSDIVKTTFFINQRYRIQNYFKEMSKSELFFANPTSKKIIFFINDNKYNLNKGCSTIIDVSNHKQIYIKSNCLFLRPIIFNYKGNFIDAYHG